MKIVIGSDHAGYELKEAVKTMLEDKGYEIMDVGCHSTESVDYPKYGHAVGKTVASGEAERGIAICGTGIGISIAANKVPGVRAGVVHSLWTAEMTKAHNDANVLCMGARVVDQQLAFDMVNKWLETEFMGDKHLRRINEIEDLDF
jgi:ribose 5-phosphate isomerase B